MTPTGFGALITADHVVLGRFDESSQKWGTVALVSRITPPRGSVAARRPRRQLKTLRGASCVLPRAAGRPIGCTWMEERRKLPWRTDASTSRRPQSNGVAEQAVRRRLEETRSLLLQSALPHPLLCEASQALCALKNLSGRDDGKKTPYCLRHRAKLWRPHCSFWCRHQIQARVPKGRGRDPEACSEDCAWHLRRLRPPFKRSVE